MSNFENSLIFLFLLCMGIQLSYHWLLFIRLALVKIRRQSAYQPPVSVVVAARNEQQNLPLLLQSLIHQQYPYFEVVVVNDRSDDRTAEIIEDFGRQFPQLKSIHIKTLPKGWTGKKQAIQQGIDSASNEILLFTDADCIPQSDHWISEMASAFTPETDIALGFSPYQKDGSVLNQFIQFETLHTAVQYLSYALAGLPYMGVGRNLAYRKKLFTQAGFAGDEKYTGGDDDIFVNRHAKKDNTQVVLSVESHMTSVPENNWRNYLTQKIRHLSAGKRYHIKDQTRLATFSLATLVGWILFIYLLATVENKALILAPFAVRSLSFYSIFTHSGQKLKVKLAYWALPLFDLCYTISYPVVGLIALTAKRIKWS